MATGLFMDEIDLSLEKVTPFKVSVVVLIDEHRKLLCSNPDDISPFSNDFYTYTEYEEREFLYSLLKILQGPDTDVKDLQVKIYSIGKTLLLENFISRLKQITTEGVHCLIELFDTIPLMLLTSDQQFNAPAGCYLRRLALAFEIMRFQDVANLFTRCRNAFVLLESSENSDAAKSDDQMEDITPPDATMNLSDLASLTNPEMHNRSHNIDVNPVLGGRYSRRQAEYFIAQQSFLLEYNEKNALDPSNMAAKIRELLHSNPALAEAHFLEYMNCLRVKEYCQALKAQYQYFDRHCLPTNSANKVEDDIQQQQRGMRYAALNLASFHYRFGHRAEALAAVREAIRMAQDANDSVCLQHSLNWLQKLGVEQGTTASAYLLERLVTRSGELNLPYLASLGVQAFAQHNALSGAKPAEVFQFLMKSDVVNCQHSLGDVMCTSFAQRSALWELYGYRDMAVLCSQALLHLNTVNMGVCHEGEAECLAFCQLAQAHHDEGDVTGSVALLRRAEERFPADTQWAHLWQERSHLLGYQRALWQLRMCEAETSVRRLRLYNADLATIKDCELQGARGNPGAGLQGLKSLLQKPDKPPRDVVAIELLCAELRCRGSEAASAIQPLIGALDLCHRHHLGHQAALCELQLAFVQYELDLPSKALSLLSKCERSLRACGRVHDVARMQLLRAKCLLKKLPNLGVMDQASGDCYNVIHREVIEECLFELNEAAKVFKTFQSSSRLKNAVYYKALLFNSLGDTTLRNQCAVHFRQLDQVHPTGSRAEIACL